MTLFAGLDDLGGHSIMCGWRSQLKWTHILLFLLVAASRSKTTVALEEAISSGPAIGERPTIIRWGTNNTANPRHQSLSCWQVPCAVPRSEERRREERREAFFVSAARESINTGQKSTRCGKFALHKRKFYQLSK